MKNKVINFLFSAHYFCNEYYKQKKKYYVKK